MFDENLHSTWKEAIMDKPGKPKTITIKINGKERPVEERKIISWESNRPPLEKKDPFEAMDELTAKEVAASQEVKEEDEFDWILPEIEVDEELREYKMAPKKTKGKGSKGIITPIKKKKSNQKKILPSILLTVFLAVLFGSSLGVLLLKMVISETTTETGGTPVDENPPEEETNSPAITTSLQLQPITGYVVQGGAFSNIEAASTEASLMVDKGLPAKPIEIEGKAYLFVGLGNSLPNAKAMGTEINNSKGIETFAKEIQIGGGEKSELVESEKALLEMAPSLYESLSDISTSASVSASIPAELQEALDENLEKWNEIGKIEDTQLLELKTELDGAITNLKNYGQNQDAQNLVQVQQHLLNFLALYGSL